MGLRKQKWLAVGLIAVLVITAATGAVYAYLSASTGPVKNTFAPDSATQPSIVETFDKTVKRNVAVDVGDPGYAVYVRVAIVATWQKTDSEGNVIIHWQMPVGAETNAVGVDYLLDWNDEDWFLGKDGFYYHKKMVTCDGTEGSSRTKVLINECYQMHAAPEPGYKLHVEIVVQTIQAKGSTDADGTPAVTDAWGVKVNGNGELVVPTT